MEGLIECKKDKMFGQPTLKGRRLTVYDIVTKVYFEDSIEMVLADYEIGITELNTAVNYCRSLSCKEDETLLKFCDGCILRTLQDGWNFTKSNYIQIINKENKTIVISKDNQEIFLGTLEELENSDFGKVTWLIADNIYGGD